MKQKLFIAALTTALLATACQAQDPTSQPNPVTVTQDDSLTLAGDVADTSTADNASSDNIVSGDNTYSNPHAPFTAFNLSPIMHDRFESSLANDFGVKLDGQLVPMGWSDDGRKLAYVFEPADEACGCYLANFVIQDLVTDKKLWEVRVNESEGQGIDFAGYWNRNSAAILEKFETHKIKLDWDFELRGQASHHDVYFEANVSKLPNPDFGNSNFVASYKVQANSIHKGQKTIHTETPEILRMLEAGVIGYIPGPDENRVAVIVGEVWLGWEGPPNTTRFKIIGSHLDTGFK